MLQHASHESYVLVLRACKMILNLCVVRWAQDAV